MTAYTPARILPLSSQYGNAEAFVIENAVEFSERHLFPRIRKGIRSSASTDTVKSHKGGLVGLENIGNTWYNPLTSDISYDLMPKQLSEQLCAVFEPFAGFDAIFPHNLS